MNIESNIKFREEIIKKQFKDALGYELDLDNPKTFNEKLQWLKLYYHDPLMTKCADKYLVRDFIKDTIGEDYLIPLLGVWDRVEDIDFDSLPNQFVLKVNWGSGQNIIVKDKSQLDIDDAKRKLREWMKPYSNHYYFSYEYCYKNIVPKIICEEYIDMCNIGLFLFRFSSFNSSIRYITLDFIKNDEIKSIHLDENFNLFNIKRKFDILEGTISKPKNYEKCLYIAHKLSNIFPHVRVDLYCIGDTIKFSELTFYQGAGLSPFNPIDWDYKFGEMLELPKEKKIEYDFIDRETVLRGYLNLEPLVKEVRDLEFTLSSKDHSISILSEELNSLKHKEIKRSFILFGLNILENYINIYILGFKISIKKNKNKA